VTDRLAFLPRPRGVERRDGAFALNAATRIQIGPEASQSTVETARGLQRALADLTGLQLDLVPTQAPARGNTISLVIAGRDDAALPAATFGWELPSDLGDQGYTLHVGPEGAVVVSEGERGLFYGVQTLIQLATSASRNWPALAISDRPVLPVRGLLLDISRMKVPTLETLSVLVRTLAHYKFNQLQLYTEHTFRFPRHPLIGADAGSLTGDDILALDAICRAHHVELVPTLQSLGHHRSLLSLPEYEHLAETPWRWSFATAEPGVFDLFDELYGDMLPAFSSPWLNIGADEPWDLGRGRSAHLTEESGIGRVYLEHIKRLHELVTHKHGRQMMMWADMFWHHPELITEFPEDILLLDWWYEQKDRYESVEVLAQAGRRFYVCPGTSSWSALFPRLENAVANIRGFVRDGVAAGAAGMLLTDWGDDGHYQLLSHSWYPYLWGVECAWTGSETESAAFDDAFGRLFLRDATGTQVAALRRLGAAMQNDPEWLTSWHSAMALFEDPLAGVLAQSVPPAVRAEARAAAAAVFPLLGQVHDPGIRHDLGFTASQIVFAANKVDTTGNIRAVLRGIADHATPSNESLARFDELIACLRRQRDALPAMVAEFELRWLAHARRGEIQVNLDRFAALITRYDAALAWLAAQRVAYAAGNAVDADLATYDRAGYAVLYEELLRSYQELAGIIGRDALLPDVAAFIETMTAVRPDLAVAPSSG
jgi:hypothetical protein